MKKLFLFGVILIFVINVSAQDYNYYFIYSDVSPATPVISASVLVQNQSNTSSGFTCTGSLASELSLGNPRPFQDVNIPFTFYVYYTNASGSPITDNNTIVQISFNSSTYNMSFDGTRWEISVYSNTTEDINWSIQAYSTNYSCLNESFLTKFRVPFYIYVQLFKTTLNSSDPQRYTTDFQYVVMINNNDSHSFNMAAIAFSNGAASIINNFNRWLLPSSSTVPVINVLPDDIFYFSGHYTLGQARIKLYEPGNYSTYVMNNKVDFQENNYWEFQRPTIGQPDYLGKVHSNLPVYDPNNASNSIQYLNNTVYKISLTKFEANAPSEIWRWIKIGIVGIIYLVIMITLAYVCSGSPQAIQILLIVGLSLGSIALLLIRSF